MNMYAYMRSIYICLDAISQGDITENSANSQATATTQEDSTPAVFNALPSDQLSTNGTYV